MTKAEITLEKLDSLITEKIDAALKPILEKLTPPKDEKKEEKEESEETNKNDHDPAIKLAADILRANLKDSNLKKEQLDTMDLNDLQIANQLHAKMKKGGIKNPIEQKKNDSGYDNPDTMWGCEVLKN